jgi:7,8-dihydroneopterin 2',3'-cyclic phosphate phosphodiesterase
MVSERELKGLLKLIENPTLKRAVDLFLKAPKLTVREAREKAGLDFRRSPGGVTRHHSYERGLIQHTVAMTKLALHLCEVVEGIYGGKVDRDVVIASCLLHDLMKAPTYAAKGGRRYVLSPLGEKLDHLSLIIAELYRKRFPLEVIHCVAAHHGKFGPISPMSLEALIVHIADYMDSTLNAEILSAAKFLIKEHVGEEVEELSSEEALRVISAKQNEGPDGVIKEYERLLRSRRRGS